MRIFDRRMIVGNIIEEEKHLLSFPIGIHIVRKS